MTVTCQDKSSVCGSYIMCQAEVISIKAPCPKHPLTVLLEYFNTCMITGSFGQTVQLNVKQCLCQEASCYEM